MRERGICWKNGSFYSHVLPSLAKPAWRHNRVAGQGWVAVGDAGGLVDPITGEGLYYAIRSGDLASQVVLSDAHAPEEKPHAYQALL
jgi:flavin-dependent dehydrogenase